ncbi:pilus assembly protein [Legionella oakridgensis]|uniref:Tfp pilus assembly protein, tip-associated adhesin PilY n=2 Tax=Legionella oakridgensis TaxID=29423 RepID=W0BGD4_9GAMM|nr:PilC/PilY family type IV pilus protein [Legionella oakridgensis]AHE67682.1 Tfp pilus assembly protein, tip-associated adhesin PilY [Legionella oakridgensis ATCC 33761 = DSM 21215]ETO92777.1 Tfp pilus assembly protein, tip-associated adhesin PilY [Legionella oakridgensis RV-2-2007]KTD36984.1 type IV fimbrial biogenesis PilY1-like protein [Legionella oakridgensis]STY20707.1 type IV fimbrial biogenesis PilY1-like protein [Legionella longbeachae]
MNHAFSVNRLLYGLLSYSLWSGMAFSAPLNLSQTPLFLTDEVAPLTMLVVSRDHKLYFEAYNDSTDIDGDGIIDIRFKPSVDYFGYFDSYKCYSYNSGGQYFYPVSVTANKQCSGQWSGNFLNYITTARLDALRKVLYGGYRSSDDTNQTILQRTYIPQDGHSWGKEYRNLAVDGYDISHYTPYSQPSGSSYHLFANTTLRNGTGLPLLRVALNQPYRIWEWVSIERPVAGSRALNGSSGPSISGITDYVVRVKVCDPAVGLEDNCRAYASGYHKPIGLLQEFGENDAMQFGLLTGTYNNNLSGGVIRKNISSITDEINLNTGQFTSVSGIIATLNRLTVTGFQTDYSYSCGWITTRNINNGECQMWGNPIAEMMYEAVRYFAGKSTPTSAFDYSGGTDASLNLPKPSWQNPYSQYPRCSKANMLVISDIYPSYDGDQVPGSYFNSISGDLSPALNAATLGQQIFTGEGFSSLLAFIGQSAGESDGAPTPKTVTSFGNIRGLAPHEANSKGSYYAASVAYYGWTNDVNNAQSKQNIKSFMIGLSSPSPEIKFNVGGNPISLIPFGKSVNGFSINPTQGQYQPTNNIVDFYIESLTDSSAVFRVNFEDVQQGADFDMDAIVKYTVTVNPNNTLTVNLETIYSAGSITQHMGYVISGTTADGVYLEVRDSDTTASSDVNYFLDTPPGQLPGQGWQDNTALPLVTTRTFTPSNQPDAAILNSPLWYAAKWGGFTDANNSGTPDQTEEFDSSGTGSPDNYFLVTNANNLQTQLAKAFALIIERTGSFSSAALSSGFLSTGTRIYQAIFRTKDWSGQLLAFAIDENNGNILTTGSGPSGSVWDAAQKLNLQNYNSGRQILTYKPSANLGIPFRWPNNPASPTSNELDLVQVNALNTNPITALNDSAGSSRLNYLRGNQAQEEQHGGIFRDRSTILGDIINSNPIAISVPEQQYPVLWSGNSPENNVSYSSFRQANLNRQAVLYVGANDGMLHAFNADTGVELFAYVPSPVYKNLSQLTSPDYTHHYYVDGSPTVIDVFSSNQWRTMLVAGLNGGGQGVYALDVTNPGQFTENNAATIVKWEFTDANDADLGFTYSQPAIVRLATGQWAAIFGNGYNNTYTDGTASTTGNAVLYIVNMTNGTIIKKFDTKAGMSADPQGLGRPNGMSSPVVVDTDGNGIADLVYAGDLFGNVWKINISSANANQWDFSFKSGSTPLPFYVARDSNGNRQPITIKPTVSRLDVNASGLQIHIGTGKYLETADKTDTSIQTIYTLRDTHTTSISGRAELRQQTILEEQGNVRVVSENLLANNDRGWYLDLIVGGVARGERIVSNMLFLNKKIIFSTIIPTDDPCDFGGESWLMELNAFSGARLNYHVFDLNNDNLFDSNDAVVHSEGGQDISVPASGVHPDVGLVNTPAVLNAGNIEYKYLPGTSGDIQKVTENPGSSRFGRQSWHQLR